MKNEIATPACRNACSDEESTWR